MAVTDVLLTLGVTVTLALLVSGRLEWAGVAAGLAASAKYPGVLLLVPLVVAGFGEWRRVGRAIALAAAAFLLTSPFVVLHAGAAWDDISRVQRLAQAGWLGFEDDPVTPLAFGERLWQTLGPLALVGLAGVAIAAWRHTRRDVVLLSFVAVYALSLLPAQAHYDRYVLPLVPVLCVLAGRGRWLGIAALVAALVPLWWSIDDARALTPHDPRLDAAAWIERNVPAGERIAVDPSTLPPDPPRVVRLELPGPERPFDTRRDLGALRRAGFRWLVVGDSVTDRVLDEASRLPAGGALLPLPRRPGTGLRGAQRLRRAWSPLGARLSHLPLREWSAADRPSTRSLSAPPFSSRALRSSGSRSPPAGSWRRRSAARSTSGGRSSASSSRGLRSGTGRAASSPTAGRRPTSSSARSRSGPCSCSRSPSSTSGCSSRSSRGIPARGWIRSSRRSSCSAR